MNRPPFRYALLLAAVEATPDPSEVALIATASGWAHDPTYGSWFQAAVRGRYQDFTRPGWPDGPAVPLSVISAPSTATRCPGWCRRLRLTMRRVVLSASSYTVRTTR